MMCIEEGAHLIFCLVTSCARLDNRRCSHWAVILTDVVGESTVVHEPEVIPFHHHGLEHDNIYVDKNLSKKFKPP